MIVRRPDVPALRRAPLYWWRDPLLAAAASIAFVIFAAALLLALKHDRVAAAIIVVALGVQMLLLAWAEWRRRALLDTAWKDVDQHRRNLDHELGNQLLKIGLQLRALRALFGESNVWVEIDRSALTGQLDVIEHEQEALDQSIRGVSRLLEIDISRTTGRKPATVVTLLHLSGVVEDYANDFTQAAQDRNVTLEAVCETAYIRGDMGCLLGIVVNLITNAVKYTEEGGRIDVSCFPVGRKSCFRIENSGPGIPFEERQKIFETGYRTKGTRKTAERGTGLGLALVQRYVREMDGTIEVREASFGTSGQIGACFEVMFPLVEYHEVD